MTIEFLKKNIKWESPPMYHSISDRSGRKNWDDLWVSEYVSWEQSTTPSESTESRQLTKSNWGRMPPAGSRELDLAAAAEAERQRLSPPKTARARPPRMNSSRNLFLRQRWQEVIWSRLRRSPELRGVASFGSEVSLLESMAGLLNPGAQRMASIHSTFTERHKYCD